MSAKLTRAPQVQVHHRFRRFFEDTLPELEESENSPGLRLLPDRSTENYLDEVFDKNAGRIILAIGPEGGWVPFEIELMRELGFKIFRLGPWVLRVETALAATLGQVELLKSKHV